MVTNGERNPSLDTIRGIAVLGILLLNAFSLTMPDAGYVNPRAWGGTRPVDVAAWATSFVLFEGKMRGLFSMLFGASMALVVDRARSKGENGAAVQYRRLFWLLLFGIAHHLLVWEGDILVQYSVVGAIAYLFVSRSERSLRRWAIGLLTASALFHAAMMGGAYVVAAKAEAAGSSVKLQGEYREMLQGFYKPGSREVARDLTTYRADYMTILQARSAAATGSITRYLVLFFFETLGLMVLGILLLRNGFFSGAWDASRYRRWAVRAYLIGIPPLIVLAAWNHATKFDTLHTFATFVAWAEPFRYPVMLGHAALSILSIRRFAAVPLMVRLSAAGRMAFTNYLATSLIVTTLFYGYGGNLFGRIGRAEVYLVVFAVWALILLWSKPWLDRFQYGPFEWLWRSLSRGAGQPFRRLN